MGTVALSGQALVTVADALAFIQDQGSTIDDNDLLRHHINGVSAMMIKLTARDRLIWVSGDRITEYRDGFGEESLHLANAPVRLIVSVDLNPNYSTAESVTVPVSPSKFSDEMFFDEASGLVVLKTREFPDGVKSVKIVYEAGYYKQDIPADGDPADSELMELRMLALNIIARRWSRYKNQRHGVASESRGSTSINYTADDLSKAELDALRRYRRTLFA